MARAPIRSVLRNSVLAALAALGPGGAATHAAPLPADCSTAAIPAGSAKGAIDGVIFTPTGAVLRLIQETDIGDAKFENWELTLTGYDANGNDLQLELAAMAPAGKGVDGRTFRQLSFPTGDTLDNMDKQPMAAEGSPEIQGWTINFAAHNISESSVENDASLRVIFGKRSATALPGQIYFCAPKVKGMFLAGGFTVDLKAK